MKMKWIDTKLEIAMELPRLSGKGKVRVLLSVDARHLEGYPEICIHHSPNTGERWMVSLASSGYKIAKVDTLDEAYEVIVRLLLAAKELGIDWKDMDLAKAKGLSNDQRIRIAEAI